MKCIPCLLKGDSLGIDKKPSAEEMVVCLEVIELKAISGDAGAQKFG